MRVNYLRVVYIRVSFYYSIFALVECIMVDPRFIIFGNNCRKIREKTGFSQENFAHEKDLQRTFYGDVERGKRNLTLSNILKIADALGVNPKQLFEDMPDSLDT